MRRLKQRIISAVAALSLLVTAIPALSISADSLSSAVKVPFHSNLSFKLPSGTSITSDSYRIPAMVTLSNGTMVAAADIRWNTTYDGGGLDTITARSTDGGVTWTPTVANYLGDNGNQYNPLSSCFIDPCLVANGNTVYMLVDLYPYGVALNGSSGFTSPDTQVGFNNQGHLLLSNNDHKSYNYYLNMNDYIIYAKNGESTGIQVDAYFNYSIPAATFGLVRPTEPTDPTEETTVPTEPTEETTVPTEPTTVPTEPTTVPTEPTTVPTEPTTVPTEPTTAPTEPTTIPTEPTTVPTEPTTVPTEPTEPTTPTEPTEPTTPTEPTEPTDPTTGEGDPSLRGSFFGGLAIKASAAEYDPDADLTPAAEEQHNLFFGDSPYKVVRTGYLYLTKSTDGGANWSTPKLLNLKSSSEQVCLVGPGRGITTSSGLMVIPIYSYNNGSQKMGFLYSSNGTDWYRVNANFSNPWSSEAAVVELSNGSLRFFFRNGSATLYYVDYTFNQGWSTPLSTGIATNSNTQISAITYSQKIDGKQVILVSCPAGPAGGSTNSNASYRTNGRIFVFTNDGSTMTLKNTVNVNDGKFMYSCLTERSDGSVAILYENAENGWGVDASYSMAMAAYTSDQLGITSGGNEGGDQGGDVTDPSGNQTITLLVGQQASRVISGAAGTSGTVTTEDGVAQYSISQTHQDSTAKLGTNANFTGETVNLHQALYTFTGDNTNGFHIQNGSVYLGDLTANKGIAGIPGTSSNDEKQVFVKNNFYTYGSNAFDIKLATSARYLYFHRDGEKLYRFDKQGSSAAQTAFLIYAPVDGNHSSSSELPGYYQITSVDQIQSGGKYLIVAKCDTNTYFVLYPSLNTSNFYAHVAKATGTAVTCTDSSRTTITFTGLKPGVTTVTVGNTVYTVTVQTQEKSISKQMLPNTTLNLDPAGELNLSSSDCTVTYQVTSGTAVSVDSTGTVTAGSVQGSAVIEAKVMQGTALFGTVTYTVNVSEVIVQNTLEYFLPVGGKAIVSGLSGDLFTSGLDTSIATVETGTAATTVSITATGVSAGDTEVIVGTTRVIFHVVPKNTDPPTANLSPSVYINVDEIEHCKVFYSINGSELYEIQGNGVLIDQTFYGGINISFYAAPEPGYALTLMTATGSLGNYYTLNYEGDISNSPAWPKEADGTTYKADHGFKWCLMQHNLTPERLKEVFDDAIALGCHGAQTFTRNDNSAINTNLTFRAEKLPEFHKEIVGYKRGSTASPEDNANGKLNINGYKDYFVFDDDVALAFGDSLLYKFTVTSTSSSVTYTNVTLKDTKIGYSNTIGNSVYNTPGTYSYYASYTISPEDVGMYSEGKFVNNAQLGYSYSSLYSTGTYGGSASSEAACDIVGLVSYAWVEGTPEAIVNNVDGRYTLPSSFSLNMYTNFSISPYTGAKTYTEKVDGIDVTWTYTEQWGVQEFGSDEMTWFQVNTALGQNFQMQHSRSLTFYGRWLARYSVVYEWEGEHPNVTLPATLSHPVGENYTVDSTYQVGSTYDDGTYTWTFQGWKLRGSNEIVTDPTLPRTMGEAHDFYTGSWTKAANASRLTIRKTGCASTDENQSFLFHISGNGIDLDVVVHGNGSVVIDGLTVGKTYTVTEKTSWSWRYQPTQASKSVTVTATGNTLTFDNSRNNPSWLSGGAWCDNRFTGTN